MSKDIKKLEDELKKKVGEDKVFVGFDPNKRKRIDVASFLKLAKEVRKIFENENNPNPSF